MRMARALFGIQYEREHTRYGGERHPTRPPPHTTRSPSPRCCPDRHNSACRGRRRRTPPQPAPPTAPHRTIRDAPGASHASDAPCVVFAAGACCSSTNPHPLSPACAWRPCRRAPCPTTSPTHATRPTSGGRERQACGCWPHPPPTVVDRARTRSSPDAPGHHRATCPHQCPRRSTVSTFPPPTPATRHGHRPTPTACRCIPSARHAVWRAPTRPARTRATGRGCAPADHCPHHRPWSTSSCRRP